MDLPPDEWTPEQWRSAGIDFPEEKTKVPMSDEVLEGMRGPAFAMVHLSKKIHRYPTHEQCNLDDAVTREFRGAGFARGPMGIPMLLDTGWSLCEHCFTSDEDAALREYAAHRAIPNE